MSPFGDTCNYHFTVTLKHNALLGVLPHCFSAHLRMGSLRQFRAHRHPPWHSLYLDTQNPHLYEKCIIAWLEAWFRFCLKPIYSISSHREQWDKCQFQKPSWGRHLAGSHSVRANAHITEDRLFLLTSSQVLPSSLSFPIGIPAISLESILSLIGIAFWRHRPLLWITKHCHLKHSVEWERAGSEGLSWASWSRLPSCRSSFKFSKRSNPETQDFSPKPLKSQMNV